MELIEEGWVDVVSSNLRMWIQVRKKPDGSLVAYDPLTNNEFESAAFCAAWFCELTGNHMGKLNYD